MELEFRRAQIMEIPMILEQSINNLLRFEDFAQLDRERALAIVKKRVETRILNYTVVLLEETQVGCFYLHETMERMELEDFYVLEPFRNRGIGTIILEHCFSKSSKSIRIYVFAGNVRAIGLYIRMGFHIKGEARNGMLAMERSI